MWDSLREQPGNLRQVDGVVRGHVRGERLHRDLARFVVETGALPRRRIQ